MIKKIFEIEIYYVHLYTVYLNYLTYIVVVYKDNINNMLTYISN